MALLDRRERAGVPEALLAELAQRLEQPVAGLVGVDQLHHRLVDEVDHDPRRASSLPPTAAPHTASAASRSKLPANAERWVKAS